LNQNSPAVGLKDFFVEDEKVYGVVNVVGFIGLWIFYLVVFVFGYFGEVYCFGGGGRR
jgi:hypothetical protein